MLEARGEIDAVRPKVDVAPGRGVAPLPAGVLLAPALGQVPDRRRREPGGIGPEQRRQGLRELPRGHALEVEPGQELFEVPRAPQVGREDRRGEADRLDVSGTAVADLGPADLDRADPGLDLPRGRVAVAPEPPTTLPVEQGGMGNEERLDLGLDRLPQHPPGALAQQRQQRVIRDARSWPGQRDNGILLHGVSSRVT